MCIIFLTTNANAKKGEYKLIVASNRDEFFNRPAKAATAWADHKNVYGGRDLRADCEWGTWLAIGEANGTIRLGALLNVTGDKCDNAQGRGGLVAKYVASEMSNVDYANQVRNSGIKHNGFNLVLTEISDDFATTVHCSNVSTECKLWPEKISLAFGNSPPNKPLEKVKCGKEKFDEIIKRENSKEMLVRDLMELLKNKKSYWPDEELARRAPNWAKHLSSICVKIPNEDYGTRTHTVILVDSDNHMDYFEQTMIFSGSDNSDIQWEHTHIYKKL